MRIYVGNLPYDVTEEELQKEFLAYGEVTSVSILTDKFSGQPKGFGFVEMASKSATEAAITGLNGKVLRERTIVVNEARPRSGNRGGGYGSGRGGKRGGGRQKRY
jgi:RNA recognition motif-containing protein